MSGGFVVLEADRHFIVVNKAAGLATTNPEGGDSLARRVERAVPRAPRCHPSSRLDAPVSGVVVFALSDEAIDACLRARAEGRYARVYAALSRPWSGASEVMWEGPIGVHPRDARLRAVDVEGSLQRRQEAKTTARCVATSECASSWALWPRTGRTHQLRVHAAHAGVPLLGDSAYGGARRVVRDDGSVLGCSRVALHCLAVAIPWRGEVRSFVAPWPDELDRLRAACGLPQLPVDDLAAAATRGASV